jgi:DNA-binding response OmpR family regulator
MDTPERQTASARILVVDDEKSARTVIARALQLSGYRVDTAEDGRQALEMLSGAAYDVMLLDLNMPVMDGSAVMDAVREHHPDLQVIILTAHASLNSAITAVKTGAVDYLLKPQSIAQIDQAVQAALKRRFNQAQRRHLMNILGEAMQTLQNGEVPAEEQAASPASGIIEMHGILFDPEQRRLTAGERTVQLTAHQAAILACMARCPGRVLSCKAIACEALGYPGLSESEAERIVRPHILKLRRKLEPDPAAPVIIRSIRGKGYLFAPPPLPSSGCD